MNIPQTTVDATMPIGMAGQLTDGDDNRVDTATSEEASTAIPFGYFVIQGTADDGAKMPSTIADVLKGIVVFSHGYERKVELGASGLAPKATFGVLVEGRCYVVLPNEDVTPADEVHVQMVAETNKPVGSLRKTGASTKTLDISALARWKTTGLHGTPVKIEIDLTNLSLAVAD